MADHGGTVPFHFEDDRREGCPWCDAVALRAQLDSLLQAAEEVAEKAMRIRDAKRLWCDFCNSTSYHAAHCTLARLDTAIQQVKKEP